MSPHPEYDKAPLVYVVAQLRHPALPAPLSTDQVDVISRSVRADLPLFEKADTLEVQLGFGPGGATQEHRQQETCVFRSRDRSTSLTVGRDSFALETTRYTGWTSFRRLLSLIVEARLAAGPIAGVERFGLRYVDDIRVPPEADGSIDWSRWIEPSLVPGARPSLNLRPVVHQGAIVYATNRTDQVVTLRYGPLDENTPVMNRPAPVQRGPYFCLDTDAAWQPSSEVPELDKDYLFDVAELLHVDVRDLFESALTDTLRLEVLHAR